MAVLGVCLLPLMSKSFYRKLLSALIGLAVGSLIASSLFHLIPAAFALQDLLPPSRHHSYLNISLSVGAGVYLFFIIERILRFAMVVRERRAGDKKANRYAVPPPTVTAEGTAASLMPRSVDTATAELLTASRSDDGGRANGISKQQGTAEVYKISD